MSPAIHQLLGIPVPPPVITPAFLRQRAREFRRQAREATTADIRDMLFDLALEYEHDADVMEMDHAR